MLRLALMAAAATAPVVSLPPAAPISTVAVPQDRGAQEVQVTKREFPAGGSSGWHTHPGVEVAYLLSGEMVLERAGQAPLRLKAGDSFTMPRGVAHNGINRGKVPARLVITYVVDAGAPVRTSVPAP